MCLRQLSQENTSTNMPPTQVTATTDTLTNILNSSGFSNVKCVINTIKHNTEPWSRLIKSSYAAILVLPFTFKQNGIMVIIYTNYLTWSCLYCLINLPVFVHSILFIISHFLPDIWTKALTHELLLTEYTCTEMFHCSLILQTWTSRKFYLVFLDKFKKIMNNAHETRDSEFP